MADVARRLVVGQGVTPGVADARSHAIFEDMKYYRVIDEADGTFTVYVNEIGTLPGRYSGFKSEADANRWAAEQQKYPDLPPFAGSGI